MKGYITNQIKYLSGVLFLGALLIMYASCQKGDPAPFATPPSSAAKANSDSTTKVKPDSTFTASINGSPTITFTPNKTIGANTSLIGTTPNYTITISFPNGTGPGTFFLTTTGFGVTLNTTSDTYYANSSRGSGILTIDSVSSGRYYGNLNCNTVDLSSNVISIDPCFFKNL
jgi:hypothetical protein